MPEFHPCLRRGLDSATAMVSTAAPVFAKAHRRTPPIFGNGGAERECGWCSDRWGISWQITPRTLSDALAGGGAEAKRAFEAMMTMKKIDVSAIDAARRG